MQIKTNLVQPRNYKNREVNFPILFVFSEPLKKVLAHGPIKISTSKYLHLEVVKHSLAFKQYLFKRCSYLTQSETRSLSQKVKQSHFNMTNNVRIESDLRSVDRSKGKHWFLYVTTLHRYSHSGLRSTSFY